MFRFHRIYLVLQLLAYAQSRQFLHPAVESNQPVLAWQDLHLVRHKNCLLESGHQEPQDTPLNCTYTSWSRFRRWPAQSRLPRPLAWICQRGNRANHFRTCKSRIYRQISQKSPEIRCSTQFLLQYYCK